MVKWRRNLSEFQEVLGVNEVRWEVASPQVLLVEGPPSQESNIGDVVSDAFAAAFPDTRWRLAMGSKELKHRTLNSG